MSDAPPLPPPVARILLMVCVLALNAFLRDTGRAVAGAHIVFTPRTVLGVRLSLPDREKSYVPLPAWLQSAPSQACVLPAWTSVELATAKNRYSGARRVIERFCRPETPHARAEHSHRLDRLIAHMQAERARLGLDSLHAWDVGVNQAILLHGDVVMLNPRVAAAREPSECMARTDDGDVWLPYHKLLDVEYEALGGAVYVHRATGLEACGLAQVV